MFGLPLSVVLRCRGSNFFSSGCCALNQQIRRYPTCVYMYMCTCTCTYLHVPDAVAKKSATVKLISPFNDGEPQIVSEFVVAGLFDRFRDIGRHDQLYDFLLLVCVCVCVCVCGGCVRLCTLVGACVDM